MPKQNRYAAAARKARELTNKQLAEVLSALAPVTSERLNELLPAKRDKEAFALLMREVEAEKEEDDKLAFLRDNLETAGRAALKVLKSFL
jgi:hypothetical protein